MTVDPLSLDDPFEVDDPLEGDPPEPTAQEPELPPSPTFADLDEWRGEQRPDEPGAPSAAEVPDPFGPESAWAADLQRARDEGDTEAARRLYAQRDVGREHLAASRFEAERRAQVDGLEAVAAYDARIAELRESADPAERAEASRLAHDRSAFVGRAEVRAENERDARQALASAARDHAMRPPPELVEVFDADPVIGGLRAEREAIGDDLTGREARMRLDGEELRRRQELTLAWLNDTGREQPRQADAGSTQTIAERRKAAEASGDINQMLAVEADAERAFRESLRS